MKARNGNDGGRAAAEGRREVLLDGESLRLGDVIAVARGGARASLAPQARERVVASAGTIAQLMADGRVVYGINTGFGKLYDVVIPPEDLRQLQVNLVRSHAVGVGAPLPAEAVRASMLLRANALAKGFSGISLGTLEALIAMLNAGVLPVVPAQGSVGASGDLAPSAHIALGLIGEGEVVYEGRRLSARAALTEAGLAPARLGPKEGLALLNGTATMTGIGALALADGAMLAKACDAAAALSFEAIAADPNVLDERVHWLRPHPGQGQSAANMRALLAGSAVFEHRPCAVQDPYSFRCAPQVHGAARDALGYARCALEVEMNSANDNPLVFASEGDALCAGNFHGEPMAMALDFAGIALAELANISERRVDRLLSGGYADLPRFLTRDGGLNSGLMLLQYTAAALVSENKILASPASVDSIPTSAGQEDHVSMGTIAARKARDIAANTFRVVAIELLTAAQAVDLREAITLGRGTRAVYEAVRRRTAFVAADRPLASEVERLASALLAGKFVREVEAAARLV